MTSCVPVSNAFATPLNAQTPSRWESITTDTGDLKPGRPPKSSYNTPLLCRAAVINLDRASAYTIARQQEVNDLAHRPLADTLSTTAVEWARACVSQFSVTSIPAEQLTDLFFLALDARNDSLAHTTIQRWLAEKQSGAVRDTALFQVMQWYLDARPARVDAAGALVDQVSTPGIAGALTKVSLSRAMLRFWSSAVIDTAQIRRWAGRILTLARPIPVTQVKPFLLDVYGAYKGLATVAYAESPDSLTALATRVTAAMRTWPRDTAVARMFWFKPGTVPADTVRQILSPVSLRVAPGDVYPPLKADAWFPGPLSKDTTAATLIISAASWNWGDVPPLFTGQGCFERVTFDPGVDCYPLYHRIERMVAQYGKRLRIVIVTASDGFGMQTLPISPDSEAKNNDWFIHDYLRLPVTLAVVKRLPVYGPQPDPRPYRQRVCEQYSSPLNDSSEIACRYLAVPAVLLDGHGREVTQGKMNATFDFIVDTFMRTLQSSAREPKSRKS